MIPGVHKLPYFLSICSGLSLDGRFAATAAIIHSRKV